MSRDLSPNLSCSTDRRKQAYPFRAAVKYRRWERTIRQLTSDQAGTRVFSAGPPLARRLCPKTTSRTGLQCITIEGESLNSYDLERLTTQVTGDVATTTYRACIRWANKTGAGSTICVLHTWVRKLGGRWQIISGMSAPRNPRAIEPGGLVHHG